ncbi:hypothetical protein EI77_04699 [Prosthecobacter fusiformis]|uniref:Uncharacterized protein n=1 Tax=Prosthecobacter fusiformis TaxID=48464 RepID=A0A4R7RJK2_9BACT|nr:hypothetical protein [Prosthecobacter fusiformis]TDU62476.1 hypothetical protein EI77_04699 [Prosthecobacter fusiformis]
MMLPPDAEATRRVTVMNGDFGEETQYETILQRSLELVDQAFDYFSFCPATGTVVMGSKEPFIQLRD